MRIKEKRRYNNLLVLLDRVDTLKNTLGLQCADGISNKNPYNFGLAQGLEIALAIMEDRRPIVLTEPKQWLKE